MARCDIVAGHCCDGGSVLFNEEVFIVVSGEIIDECCEHFLWGRARLGLLLVVVVVLCEPVMPNGRFRTVCVADFSHVGSVVEMGRIRGAVAVPDWGWLPWCGPGVVGAHCWLWFG